MQIQHLGTVHAMLGHAGHFVGQDQSTHCSSDFGTNEGGVRPEKFRCSPAAKSLLTPSGTDTINSVIRHGGSVAFLRTFVRGFDARRGAPNLFESDCRGGLYLSAIAGAVGKLLRKYHAAIAELEAHIAEDPELGVEYLHAQTTLASAWIQPVSSFVSSILSGSEDFLGCKLLDIVNSHISRCGDDITREALENLRDAAASVLWNQVWHWVERGVLVDPNREFFVSRAGEVCASYKSREDKSVGAGNHLGDENFALALELLPSSTVSLSTAQRIMFAGRSIRILRRHEDPQHSLEIETEDPSAGRYKRFSSLSTERGLELLVDDVASNISRRLYFLLVEKCCFLSHVENIHQSFLLGDGMFYTQFFEEYERIRISGDWSRVGEHFWEGLDDFPGRKWWFHNRVVTPIWNQLYGLEVPEVYHHKNGGEVCAFGWTMSRGIEGTRNRGIEAGISQLSDLLRFSLISQTGPDAHAAGKLLAISLFQESQNDATDMPHAHVTRLALCDIHSSVMGALSSEFGALGNRDRSNGAVLKLEYQIPTPLELLMISSETQNLYLRCFRRLFALHRAQSELRQCWRIMMSPPNRRSSGEHDFLPQLWKLRSQMEFLTSTLFSYLQCDVIESAMHELRMSIQTSDRYEDLREAYGLYVGKIRRGLFLDDVAIGEALSKVLALIHRTVAIARRMDDLVGMMSIEVARLRTRFVDEAAALFGLLRMIDSSLKLTMRLDFNGWFSR